MLECNSYKYYNFAYVTANVFLYMCGQLGMGFTFVPGTNASTINVIDFNTYVGVGDY